MHDTVEDVRTEFSYAELSDEAKERALEEARTQDTGYDWWDSIYEDAVTVGALLGIEIGREYRETCIFFSGFWSQGDGACYTGHYSQPAHDVVKAVTEHAPQDEELKRIAEGLTVLQVTARMQHRSRVAAAITTSGNYSHSGTMNASVSFVDALEDFEWDISFETDLTRLLRDFADWIYKQLKAEDEYMHSDEYLIEGFECNDHKFDEDGVMI